MKNSFKVTLKEIKNPNNLLKSIINELSFLDDTRFDPNAFWVSKIPFEYNKSSPLLVDNKSKGDIAGWALSTKHVKNYIIPDDCFGVFSPITQASIKELLYCNNYHPKIIVKTSFNARPISYNTEDVLCLIPSIFEFYTLQDAKKLWIKIEELSNNTINEFIDSKGNEFTLDKDI